MSRLPFRRVMASAGPLVFGLLAARVLAQPREAGDAEIVEPAPPTSAATPTPPAAPAPSASRGPDTSAIEQALAADRAEKRPKEAEAPPVSPPPPSGAARSMNPDLSLILDAAGAYFSERHNGQAGAHDPTVTGFNLQALELAAGAAVDPYLKFNGNLVFGLSGVELEEAYGTTLGLPYRFQARFGQFLHRFGRINPTHPHSWDFVDQPLALSRAFGGDGGRGLGVELSWLSPLPWYLELAGSAQNAWGGTNARSFLGDDRRPIGALDDLLYVSAVKQFFALSDDWSLFWGLSGAMGPNPSGRRNHTNVFGTDVYLKYRPITEQSFTIVSLQTEWLYRRRQVPGDILQDISGYAQLCYRFAQRWATAGRYEWGSPSWNLERHVGTDPLEPAIVSNRHRTSLSVTFWPTEFSRFRLQGSRDLPGSSPGVWAAFLAAELVTGAHGAHTF
jgi:hypothetical protein